MDEKELYTLLTIAEVARLWGKHPYTVRYGMGARNRPLFFRQTLGGEYLITYESCVRRWGKPLNTVYSLP